MQIVLYRYRQETEERPVRLMEEERAAQERN
jgi:hypothetical protein